MSPELDLYNYFFNLSQEFGFDTYDSLPAQEDNADYPFVVIGNADGVSGNTKTELTGSVNLNIDCWGTLKERLIISKMIERFFYASIGELNTESYRYYGEPQQQNKRLLTDNSVPNTQLLHGLVEIDLKIQ